MQTVSKELWLEWVRNPVTNAVFRTIEERISNAKDTLAERTNERDTDQFYKGMIWAFNEVLEVNLVEPIGDEEDEV